jgi:hypothetical protein
MAVVLLRRWAATAPVPVHAVAGADGLAGLEDLALDPGVTLTDSPRHAAVLVVRGTLREVDRDHLHRLHDQMPHPRATLWWGTAPGDGEGLRVDAQASPLEPLRAVWAELMSNDRPSEPDLQPDMPPNEWRGKGDFGQGGEGMMGGVPYGRPMAMTDDDLRDGLALDAYTAEVGPFLSALPPGLLLTVTLQGDVLQSAEVVRAPYTQAGLTPHRRLARLARLLGLPALAERIRRTSVSGADLERRLRRAGVFAALPPALDLAPVLRAWCHGRASEPRDIRPDLPGLEWHEAVLLLNAHPPVAEDTA